MTDTCAEVLTQPDRRVVSHEARRQVRPLMTSKRSTQHASPNLDNLGAVLTRRSKGQALNDGEIRMALRVVLQCKREQCGGAEVSTSQPFLRASALTGVAERTLREKWEEFEKSELMPQVLKLPSRRAVTPNARVLGQEDLVAVRQELQERHAAGKTVVLAHIRQFLIQKRHKNVARSTLQAFLKRMGFIFCQKRPSEVRKEGAVIVERRNAYLRKLLANREAASSLLEISVDESYVHTATPIRRPGLTAMTKKAQWFGIPNPVGSG